MATDIDIVDVGDEVPPLAWTPTIELSKAIAALTEGPESPSTDRRPGRFDSSEVAQREGLPGVILPGNYGMMFLAQAVIAWLPEAFIRSIDSVFRQPLAIGQSLQATGVVTDKREEDGQTILELDLYNVREDGQRPQSAMAIAVIPKKG